MYSFYSLLYSVALLFLLPVEYFKRPREIRRRWLRERFGFLDSSLMAQHASTVWIHAVSVGEVIAAIPLIRKLTSRHPSVKAVVSTVTDTGQKVAREKIGDQASIVYSPFDLSLSISRLAANVRPSLFIIMETELWPNMIRILARRGIPIVLMNGRISEKSFAGYRKVGFFLRPLLKAVSFFCMQNDVYAERIRHLGAEPERVASIGSFKFDTRPSFPAPEWTKMLRGPVVVAGSTHRTEEDLIIDAYVRLKAHFPGTNLIVAPRHPERFREVEELVKKRGIPYVRRSELADPRTEAQKSGRDDDSGLPGGTSELEDFRTSGRVIILDVMGELASVYGACDIAVLGGSFIDHGGQNPLEPAFWGKAIVCGPHMENFPFIDDFYRSCGAVSLDEKSLYTTLLELLKSPEERASMGKIAKDLYEKNAGATDRALEVIERYLK